MCLRQNSMKTYKFLVDETTVSEVDIKAETEQEARRQWDKFSRGKEDAPHLEVHLLRGYGSGYALSDLINVTNEE